MRQAYCFSMFLFFYYSPHLIMLTGGQPSKEVRRRKSIMAKLFTLLQKQPVRWTMAIGWSIWISILLVLPEASLVDMGVPPGPSTSVRELAFTGVHLLAFAAACALWFWAWFGHLRLLASLVLATCITIGIGTLTEYLQMLVPDRYFSWSDFIANYAGALIAALFIWCKQTFIASWTARGKSSDD